MPSLKELFEQNRPLTSETNLKGGDPEIIGFENQFGPSLDLSKDEAALKKARGGVIGQGTPRGYTSGNRYGDSERK
jgi:hypothetical protein